MTTKFSVKNNTYDVRVVRSYGNPGMHHLSNTSSTGKMGMALCSGFLHQTQPLLNYLIIDISGAMMRGGPFEIACQKIGMDIISVPQPPYPAETYEVKTEIKDPYGRRLWIFRCRCDSEWALHFCLGDISEKANTLW
jgi:uncharacterized SAM-dependent methyltransferase